MVDERAVRTLRRLAPDRVQVAGTTAGEGDAGLLDTSRAPHHCPHRTGDDVEALLLAARREYGWGAKKLVQVLTKRHPAKAWPGRRPTPDGPAESSVADRL